MSANLPRLSHVPSGKQFCQVAKRNFPIFAVVQRSGGGSIQPMNDLHNYVGGVAPASFQPRCKCFIRQIVPARVTCG